MKIQLYLSTLLCLPLLAHGQIESKQFSRGATASISRVSLFKKAGQVEPTVLWSQFDATKRSSLVSVIPGDSKVKVRVLAENTPDAAIEVISKIVNSAKFKGLDASSSLEFSRSIAQIKRSASVDNFRNLSYRLSEMLNNDGTINPDVRDVLKQLISAAESTAKEDAQAASDEAQRGLAIQKNVSAVITVLSQQIKEASADSVKRRLTSQMVSLVK